MKSMLLTLLVVTMLGIGCANQPAARSTTRPTSATRRTPTSEAKAQIRIYSAVIRRLVTKDHTFGRGLSPFNYVYVVNGSIKDAGDPLGDHFGPASKPFPSKVVDGIKKKLQDLPPLRFIIDANDLRLGKEGMGGVKNDGVIISLGPIEQKKGRVHVSNGLWCGGTCGQWLTYVLAEDEGRWKITGTTGPYAIS